MKERIIGVPTAILSNELGYDWVTGNLDYMMDGIYPGSIGCCTTCTTYIKAPTQTLLHKWLNEVHNIHIWVTSKTIENSKTIYIPHGRTLPDTIKNNIVVDIIPYNTHINYEEALEIGLQEALKFIKNEKKVTRV